MASDNKSLFGYIPEYRGDTSATKDDYAFWLRTLQNLMASQENQSMYPAGRYRGLEETSGVVIDNTLPMSQGGQTNPYLSSKISINPFSDYTDPLGIAIHENAHLRATKNIRALPTELLDNLTTPEFKSRLKKAQKEYELSNDFVSDPWSELARLDAQLPVGQSIYDTPVGKLIFDGMPKQRAAMLMVMSPTKSKAIMEQTDYLKSMFPTNKDNLYPGQGIRDTLKNFLANPEPVVNVKGLFESIKDWTKQKRKK